MDNINNDYRTSVIEALIISSPEPLPAKKIAEVVEDMTPSRVNEAVDSLNEKYRQTDSSFRIRQIAGGYQCYITEEYSPFVDELHTRRRNVRLSRPALETLAIIAYRQPVTKIDVEMIRGVASDSAIHTLLERKLITMAGRSQAIGRPLLYKTTDEFLKYFNLNTLNDLPQMAEIEELISSDEDSAQQHLPLGPFAGRVTNGKFQKLTLEKGPESPAGPDDNQDAYDEESDIDDEIESGSVERDDDRAVFIPAENSDFPEKVNFEDGTEPGPHDNTLDMAPAEGDNSAASFDLGKRPLPYPENDDENIDEDGRLNDSDETEKASDMARVNEE